MNTTIDSKIQNLVVGQIILKNIDNKKNRNKPLDKLVSTLSADVRENTDKYIRNDNVTAYQDLIDRSPDRKLDQQPGPIILTDLILKQGYLPTISRVVDCMNVISIKHSLTISIWDEDRISGDITYRFSQSHEKYWPFMGDEYDLQENEIIASDTEKVLCLVRYRDSKYAPVTLETENIVVHVQGVGVITETDIKLAVDELKELLIRSVGGEPSSILLIRK